MNSYRQNKKPPTLFAALMMTLLLSVAFFAADTLSSGLVRSYTRTMASLGWGAVSSMSTGIDESGILASRRSLVAENKTLKGRLALHDEETARYQALESENEILRAMARVAETERDGMTARVLSSFGTSPYGTFLIGAGRADGVNAGSVVLTPGGFVLGTITDLDAHTATVASLFAPADSVELIVRDVTFAAEGRGGGNARGEVPREAQVSVGDTAIVPLFNGRVAGVIGSIESASSSATQTLFIRLPVNLDSLTFVYVVPRK